MTHFDKTLIYNQAKQNLFENDIEFTNSLKTVIELEDCRYESGFLAYYFSINLREDNIDALIKEVREHFEEEKLHHKNVSQESLYEEYTACLINIAFSIVDNCPDKALKVYYLIQDTYSMVGSVPHEVIDLSVAIVSAIAKTDVERALNLVEIIEVPHYQIKVLESMSAMTIDVSVSKRIKESILLLK